MATDVITNPERKSNRLHFRIQPKLRGLLEEAAAILGLDLTEFALSVLSREAQQVIEQHEIIRVTEQDRVAFGEMWNNRDALPDSWHRGAKVAARIKRK